MFRLYFKSWGLGSGAGGMLKEVTRALQAAGQQVQGFESDCELEKFKKLCRRNDSNLDGLLSLDCWWLEGCWSLGR